MRRKLLMIKLPRSIRQRPFGSALPSILINNSNNQQFQLVLQPPPLPPLPPPPPPSAFSNMSYTCFDCRIIEIPDNRYEPPPQVECQIDTSSMHRRISPGADNLVWWRIHPIHQLVLWDNGENSFFFIARQNRLDDRDENC